MVITTFIILFSIVHSSLLNHWVPLSLLVKEYKIPVWRSILVFVSATVLHNFSTISFAYLVGWLKLLTFAHVEHFTYIGGSILILLGGYYLITRRKKHTHSKIGSKEDIIDIDKSFWATYGAILVSMFFSPCIDVALAFFTLNIQFYNILYYCFLYFTVSVIFMSLFMLISYRGLLLKPFQFMEKNSRLIMGILFIAIGIFSFFGDNLLDNFVDKLNVNPFENY